MTFIDFQALKQRVTIEQVVAMLGLRMKQSGHQWRGPCPVCKSGGDRSLAVNTGKQAFYCFPSKACGDLIALTAHIRGISPSKEGQREAAEIVDRHFGNSGPVNSAQSTVPNSSPQPHQERTQGALRPLEYLQAGHEAVQALGVSTATAQAWGAGYAPKGIMRGRLAIPIHDRGGTLLAYCGRSVKGESPTLTFPNGFDPHSVIFAAERVQEGPLCLVRDPLQVLTAYEQGVENVVAFLTDGISAQQLEMLAALMDEKKCESVELY
jgi:CHC2 zinc finger